MKLKRESLHPREKLARHFFYLETEKILNLSARDEDGNSVCEADDDRSREISYRRAQPGYSERDKNRARHQGAHEQPVHPVLFDDSCHDDDERAGRTADLGS